MDRDLSKLNFEEEREGLAFQSINQVYRIKKPVRFKRPFAIVGVCLIIVLFLPWTQNIKSNGKITTLTPDERTQQINAIIGGKILKWFVREGQFVRKGDTIAQIGEVKVEYFDTLLLDRTRRQIEAKKTGIEGYRNKASSGDIQSEALTEAGKLKLNAVDNKIGQQVLKLASDSADYIAAGAEYNIAVRQVEAARIMLDSGVISLVDFERRKLNLQNATAKKVSTLNKFLNAKQELIGLQIEKNGLSQEYIDKVAKAEAEKFASLSNAAAGEADLAKLENLLSNYNIRNQYYFITAPQDGQIIRANKAGLGEIIKEGDLITEIVPRNSRAAVEIYVTPNDLPLIQIGQKVRFVFDGYPAIVFSGWPGASYGTFGGEVVTVENALAANGYFRVLVKEDTSDRKWPPLMQGSGAKAIALLKEVPVGYEIWRHVNGFPPDYYIPSTSSTK